MPGFSRHSSGSQLRGSSSVVLAFKSSQLAASFALSVSSRFASAAIPTSGNSDFGLAAAGCSDRSAANRWLLSYLKDIAFRRKGRFGKPGSFGAELGGPRDLPVELWAGRATGPKGKAATTALIGCQKLLVCRTNRLAADGPDSWSFEGTGSQTAVSLPLVARLARKSDHVSWMQDWRGYLNSYKG